MMITESMKRFALAVAVVAAGLGSSCRGETRPAAEPEAGSKAAEAKPADRAAAASGERGAAEPGRRAERAREAPSAAEPEPPPRAPVIADGTELVVTLETAVSSDKSRAEDLVVGKLAEPIRSGERIVIPAGSEVRGHVLAAQRSGKVKGLARLAVAFDRIEVKGKTYRIEASPIDVTAQKQKGRDAKIIGGAAAVGAIIGGIKDGGGGAAKGGLLGGAAGTGAVLLTRGQEVEFPAGSSHKIRLTRSLSLD
jgi:hypothetical protein